MDKRKLHHYWTKIRRVKPWYFLVLAIISGVICLFALRANNLQMVSLRQEVYTVDKNNGDVETALRNLREFVYGHMNTNLSSGPNAVHPPIQLKYTYERLQRTQSVDAGKSSSEIYTDAQHYCEAKIPNGVSGRFRLDCIKSYVTQHKVPAGTIIPKNLYQFDFVSPSWSPDLAGWSLVAVVLFVLMFVGTWIFQNVIRHWLRRRA
jgi:preprotein translocase subunit SecF